MKEKISNEQLAEYGIYLNHEKMDNGELRFRLMGEDGSGYIRVHSGENSAWQNSHFHKSATEITIVQKGWLAFAKFVNDEMEIKILKSGESVISIPGVIHNVYVPKNTIAHTVKYGYIEKNDWYEHKEFDKMTKKISEEELLRRHNK